MFHTYITTSCGNQVDIDRASFLMDGELFRQVLEEIYIPIENNIYNQWPEDGMDQDCAFRMDAKWLPQKFWARYCELHHEKYHEPFLPDVKPDWDK